MKDKNHIIVKEKIPCEIEDNTVLNIFTNHVTAATHGFHKYPAKFIPLIPRWGIDKYLNNSKRRMILDPFCGSGTTLVEGMLSGNHVIGIDIDPLSVLISKVKTTRVDINLLDEIADWIVGELNSGNGYQFTPECKTIRHWFTNDSIDKLSKIRAIIDGISEKFHNTSEALNIQNLFFICFSSILRRVSNADNESQKTYVSHTKIKVPEEPFELFFKQVEFYRHRLSEYSKIVDKKLTNHIIEADSTISLKNLIGENSVDLVITSPPYIKAIDYIYNQMIELFWIGDLFGLQTQAKQNKKKKLYVGTKHIHKHEYEHYSPFETLTHISELDKKIQEVYTTDIKNGHKHSYITYRYFTEMEKHFSEIRSIIKRNKHYIMVIGDSSVSKIFFNTSNFITTIAEENGFKLMNKWKYKIKNRFMRFDRKGRGGIIQYDWVLDFLNV